MSAVEKAIQEAGGRVIDLARLVGVSQQAASGWRKQGYVPWRRAVAIEAKLGVPRQELIDPRLRHVATGD